MQPFADHTFDVSPQPIGEGSLSKLPKQTSSPDVPHSSFSPGFPGPVPRIRRRNRMITSCLECRRRKLKCDKSHPCTNCTKFSRDCMFLAPALDSASQLKLTEIKEKMGSLEKVLEHDVAMKGTRKGVKEEFGSVREEEIDATPETEEEKHLEPTPLALVDAMYDDDADDDLLDLGIALGKLRLNDRLGGFFRPKLGEELTSNLTDLRKDSRSLIDNAQWQQFYSLSNQDSFMAPGPTYIAPTSGFFFSAGSHGKSLIDFLPSKLAADRLLQQYWYAVHPIASVVHKPSFQRRYETFWNEVQMGIEPVGSLQAVVFAAMFSGVVSMPEDMIFQNFGVSKKALEDNFLQGTETALSRANLLRTTKIETLQAFVMYMIPLCRDQISRAHSALCGTAIRLAECMGLHRDGTDYGLGPVETHVRRLIWYQLCFLDIRTCEAQGPRPGIRQEDFDTKLPLNVDEAELEKADAPTKSAKRWTDMTLPLIRMECHEMHRTIWIDRPRLDKKQISLTAVLGKIENFRRMIDKKYLPLIDDNVPIQRCAHLLLIQLTVRMHIMVLHRYHNSVSTAIPDRLRQIILTSGTEQMEAAVAFETHPAVSPWKWYSGAFNQYHTAFLLLIEVFAYPMRKEADRIWKVLDYVFEVPPDLTRDQKGRLILTAIRHRTSKYSEARKVRVPTMMLQRIQQEPRLVGLSKKTQDLQAPHENLGNLMFSSQEPVPTMQTFTAPSLDGSSDTLSNPDSIPHLPSMSDDLMADIDWNEWDKLFPPDTNTGELDLNTFI